MEVVRAGERMGCTEALFSLGDKPELLFPQMRDTLRRYGYKSTLHYLEAMCEKVLRESSLLPHPNPGLMSAEWLERLSRVAPSVGLMLETTSVRLLAKNAAHDNALDKDPAKRLRVIEDAGQRKIPFTTGILIGIGETLEERVDALIAIRDLHARYGHIQEVIVQNFRGAPPDAENEYSSAAESLRSERWFALCRSARWRHQRLGRSFAVDAGFHQSGKAVAASRRIAAADRSERIRVAPAVAGLS